MSNNQSTAKNTNNAENTVYLIGKNTLEASDTVYFMHDGVFMTTNLNGTNREQKPLVPFREFLDVYWNGLAEMDLEERAKHMIDFIDEMVLTELKFLPFHMRQAADKAIDDFIDVVDREIDLAQEEEKKADE